MQEQRWEIEVVWMTKSDLRAETRDLGKVGIPSQNGH